MSPADALSLAKAGERIEADAYVSMIGLAPPKMLAQHPAVVTQIDSSIVFSIPGVDWMTPNRMMGLGVFGPASETQLDELLGFCRRYRPQRFFVTVCACSSPSPALIGKWLFERGFKHHNDWVKMCRRGAGGLPQDGLTELRIERIGRDQASDFAGVVVEGFGYPESFQRWLELPVGERGWHHFLAYDGSKPVGTGALYVEGDVANLLLGSTLRSHRGKGAQTALLRERLRYGSDLGCGLFVTETHTEEPGIPNPSYHNMKRMGFEQAYLRPNYVLTSQ